jgi:hypothetical protein
MLTGLMLLKTLMILMLSSFFKELDMFYLLKEVQDSTSVKH